MIRIGIDISKNSTAMYITLPDHTDYSFTYTKKSKWTKDLTNYVINTVIDYDDKVKDYSLYENVKLTNHKLFAKQLLLNITETIKDTTNIGMINIEGYSYSSSAGQIVDIVQLGTTIRHTLRDNLPITLKMMFTPPSSLKKSTCKLVYGKDRNDNNIAGGKFKKHEMLEAINKYGNNKLQPFISSNYDSLINMKSIPSPISDIVDAFFLKEIIPTK